MYADIHRQRVRKDLRVTRSTSCIGQFNDFFIACMQPVYTEAQLGLCLGVFGIGNADDRRAQKGCGPRIKL